MRSFCELIPSAVGRLLGVSCSMTNVQRDLAFRNIHFDMPRQLHAALWRGRVHRCDRLSPK